MCRGGRGAVADVGNAQSPELPRLLRFFGTLSPVAAAAAAASTPAPSLTQPCGLVWPWLCSPNPCIINVALAAPPPPTLLLGLLLDLNVYALAAILAMKLMANASNGRTRLSFIGQA